MSWTTIVLAGAVMVVLAVVMVVVLGRASRAWRVQRDPRVAAILESLAGLDCGQCGHPTCDEYAHAIATGAEPINKCLPGGAQTVQKLADFLGIQPPDVGSHFAVVHCGAVADQRRMAEYSGEPTCAGTQVVGDVQPCAYGCLGLGDCERVCPFDAIAVRDGLAVVDFGKCTACGTCVAACPRNIITIEEFPADRTVVVACSNRDAGKDTRAVCPVGCIACGICARTCPETFRVEGDLSRIDYEAYGPDDERIAQAAEKCPTACLPHRGPGAQET